MHRVAAFCLNACLLRAVAPANRAAPLAAARAVTGTGATGRPLNRDLGKVWSGGKHLAAPGVYGVAPPKAGRAQGFRVGESWAVGRAARSWGICGSGRSGGRQHCGEVVERPIAPGAKGGVKVWRGENGKFAGAEPNDASVQRGRSRGQQIRN